MVRTDNREQTLHAFVKPSTTSTNAIARLSTRYCSVFYGITKFLELQEVFDKNCCATFDTFKSFLHPYFLCLNNSETTDAENSAELLKIAESGGSRVITIDDETGMDVDATLLEGSEKGWKGRQEGRKERRKEGR